jgi:hypothetical protein
MLSNFKLIIKFLISLLKKLHRIAAFVPAGIKFKIQSFIINFLVILEILCFFKRHFNNFLI